jgi:hypothetical protein
MTRTQSRGRQVWEAAMKKAKTKQQQPGSSGADSGAAGSEKHGLDQFQADIQKRFGFRPDGNWPWGTGPQGPGPEGPGPEGPGPEDPSTPESNSNE